MGIAVPPRLPAIVLWITSGWKSHPDAFHAFILAACNCNPYGTANLQRSCNQVTGQCECLSHVTERDCSSCEPGFYNLQSGRGCERWALLSWCWKLSTGGLGDGAASARFPKSRGAFVKTSYENWLLKKAISSRLPPQCPLWPFMLCMPSSNNDIALPFLKWSLNTWNYVCALSSPVISASPATGAF